MQFKESIIELLSYKKGDIIPLPDQPIDVGNIQTSPLKILCIKEQKLTITRRSLVHILQKQSFGVVLAFNITKCLENHDAIFISDHFSARGKRFIVLSKRVLENRSMAVVLEITHDKTSVVTAMIADSDYLFKKYKKL
ncbi:MAG: hypothetical protein KGJ35_03480 [Patescibacteria group bacterium]|nr:hypothetical protein [Patescibacteria group bacterium]